MHSMDTVVALETEDETREILKIKNKIVIDDRNSYIHILLQLDSFHRILLWLSGERNTM